MNEEHTKADRQLRWVADAYEQAQGSRIRVGEQIRAVLQGRDETWHVGEEWLEDDIEAEVVLKDILRAETMGPVPLLGRTYLRFGTEEKELQKEMEATLTLHPVFPWLNRVRGMGKTLSCKILARLDPTMADTPSAFAMYCGLATVPGEKWRCASCGKERIWPVGTNVTGNHQTLEGKKCKDLMVMVAGPDNGIRAAMPTGYKSSYIDKETGEEKERRAYDAYAKKIMWQIATSFVKCGGPYEQFFRKERAKLDRERPGWAKAGKHFTALRKTEKLFLSHLWLVWREALGLPITEPYAHGQLGHTSTPISPWDMVEEEE